MSEEGAQGGQAQGQNQNEQNTNGQGSADVAQPPKSQSFLLREFHSIISSALVIKAEEACQHAYLDARAMIDAVAEWVREEAARLGWNLSDHAVHAIASAAVLDQQMKSGADAVTPPAGAAQPAA